MIIRRVRVRRFRKLADQTLACGPGLNVVRGRNDAGKSTLHLAFSAALYPVRPSEAQSYGPWGDDGPGEVMLEFEADGRTYRLQKDLGARKVLLTCGEDRWDSPKAVEEQIGRILGLPSLALFRATAHIGQWELAAVQREQEEIGTRLARIMTGGENDAGRVLRALDDKIRRMEVGLRGVARTPGPLKRDEDRAAQLAAEQHRLAAEVAAIERAVAERDRLAARVVALEQQVRSDEALLEANRELYDLDRRCEELSGRAGELRSVLERVDAQARAIDEADRECALAPLPPDPEAVRALTEAALRAEVLEQEAAALPGDPAGPEEPAPMHTHSARAAAYGAVAAIASGGVGLGLLAGRHAVWGIGLLLAAAFLGAAAVLAHRRHARAAVEAAALARRRSEEARRVASLRREALEAREAVRRRLEALGASSVQEVVESRERYLEARRRREAAREILDGILGGRPREALALEYRRVLVDLGAARAQREARDLALRRLDPAAFQRLHADVEQRKRERDAARAELQRLEGWIAGRSPHDDLARVEEELAEVRSRLARGQRHVEVLRLTREVLADAYRQVVALGRERLEQRASEYLRGLSGGVYERLQVDDQTLAPRVWVGPPKEWAAVAEREIGSGGVDQCYLALRLGLVDVLSGGRRPPLFMDDPFLAYDDVRQAAAMATLRELARGRQIFLFTCKGVYDAYADYLLPLGDLHAVAE